VLSTLIYGRLSDNRYDAGHTPLLFRLDVKIVVMLQMSKMIATWIQTKLMMSR
jgi:hypothetical protein